MRPLFFSFFIIVNFSTVAQKTSYSDSLKSFQKNYIQTHEVVKKSEWKYFKFFPVAEKYRVLAAFEKINDTSGFIMKTSGKVSKKYFRYGMISFTIDKKPFHLTVYQSEQLMKNEEYKNYLFVPFTDLTSGEQSYAGGKYMDFMMDDIKNNTLLMDFNKAYNPYCAYATGYNCPIPPRENDLPVAIKAGEMAFGKAH